jgi:amino acid transporter
VILIEAVVIFHTRFSFWLSNGIGVVKVLTLLFIGITGLVVLGGHTSVAAPQENFINAFEGQVTAYGVTNALYKIVFSYAGYENAFNLVNEVKVSPSISGFLSKLILSRLEPS